MGVRKMLLIDRWVGIPLCWLLTRLRRLFVRRAPASGAPIRRILFIKLAEQGSTVLACQALRDAAARVGRENVYMMVFDNNRFILDLLGVIPPENVIPLAHRTLPALVRAALAAVLRLRRLGIDAAVDLEFFARSSVLIAALTGAPVRVGFHPYFGEGPYRGNLLTHRVRYNPHLHTTATFAMLVAALDCPPAALPRFDWLPPSGAEDGGTLPPFRPTEGEVAEMRALLSEHTGAPADALPPLFLLNANASDLIPLRRWESARYVELARRLLAHFPQAHVVFTGAPEEATKARGLVEQVVRVGQVEEIGRIEQAGQVGQVDEAGGGDGARRCSSLAGRTTLRQLLVLYTLADVLVTNDSGPAHFAALTPIHTVTLFGPETPLLFAAQTPRNTALWAGIACSPCVSALNNRQSACRDNVCMKRLAVEQVFAAVCASYQQKRGAARAGESVVSSSAEEMPVAGAAGGAPVLKT